MKIKLFKCNPTYSNELNKIENEINKFMIGKNISDVKTSLSEYGYSNGSSKTLVITILYTNDRWKIVDEEEFVEIYCPMDKKKVPVWHCVGSFIQRKDVCKNWAGEAVINPKIKTAKVLCMYEEEERKNQCPKCKSIDTIVTDLGFGHNRITCNQCGYYYDMKR